MLLNFLLDFQDPGMRVLLSYSGVTWALPAWGGLDGGSMRLEGFGSHLPSLEMLLI